MSKDIFKTTKKTGLAIFYAFIAAVFYALNAPGSKILLEGVEPKMLAGLLYLGAGLGIGFMSLFRKSESQERLSGKDMPFVVGMVVLDILAPIFLMVGLSLTDAATVSLLNNFEIVATTLVALLFFREKVSGKLWIGIALVTVSSILLSCDFSSGFDFTPGALLVLAAAVCWGFENNCTRMLSSKNTFQIVFIKGIFSGTGSVVAALVTGEVFPGLKYIVFALLLGFVAYGLSIFFYIRAQNGIGASKTSAYYAVAPFIGALLSFVLLKENPGANFVPAFLIMVVGTAVVVWDTLSAQSSER